MFTFNVDLGQLIIASLIAIVGWFVNRTVQAIEKRLEKHDEVLTYLAGEVKYLRGLTGR